jgi:lycopene cyclase domain-containing protein
MMTYLLLNAAFFLALAVIIAARHRSVRWKAIAGALAIVLALTALFDPIMIAVGLVAYDDAKLSGLCWFGAPIEDFAYALFAVPFVAIVWQLSGVRND